MAQSNKFSHEREKIIFLSHFISRNTPLYGGKNKVKITHIKEIKRGDPYNSLFLEFPNHASTHVDLPLHFLKKGKTLSDYPSRFWLFNNVQLVNLKLHSQKKINEGFFKNLNRYTELLLIKTGFGKNRSKRLYYKGYPYFSASLAAYLKKRMAYLKAIGIDCISISSPEDKKEGRKAHYEFLRRGIILIEDMKLSPLTKSPSCVIVSPLLIKDADGVPATVFAIIPT